MSLSVIGQDETITQLRPATAILQNRDAENEKRADQLAKPLPFYHPKAWYYGVARLGLTTIGRLSKGVRIGLTHGFDSGVMLDYVYENRAQGTTPIGRLIDRQFLDAVGWRGIRNRRVLVADQIARTLRAQHADGITPRLLDVACGGGRYALDALDRVRDLPVEAELRDYMAANVETARANAAAAKIDVTVRQADAFSDTDLARRSLDPTVIVVSGLHEIIPDDNRIKHHFRQLARLLPPGGRLLVTVQPEHPDLELIARTLRSHTGEPWAMRLRSLDLTRSWLGGAGLTVETVAFEELGIFGIIEAVKS